MWLAVEGFCISLELHNNTEGDSTMWKAEKQENTNEFHTGVDQLERSKNAEETRNKHTKRIWMVRQLHKQSGNIKNHLKTCKSQKKPWRLRKTLEVWGSLKKSGHVCKI